MFILIELLGILEILLCKLSLLTLHLLEASSESSERLSIKFYIWVPRFFEVELRQAVVLLQIRLLITSCAIFFVSHWTMIL